MKKLEDLFTIQFFEDETFFAESKETFTHDEEGLKFEYKYGLEAICCEGGTFYALIVIPTPQSLSVKKLERVISFAGVNKNEVNSFDIESYGLCVNTITSETEGNKIEENVLEELANSIDKVESLFGFYMDKHINPIGWTGWNILQNAINNVPLI